MLSDSDRIRPLTFLAWLHSHFAALFIDRPKLTDTQVHFDRGRTLEQSWDCETSQRIGSGIEPSLPSAAH